MMGFPTLLVNRIASKSLDDHSLRTVKRTVVFPEGGEYLLYMPVKFTVMREIHSDSLLALAPPPFVIF